MWPPCNAPGGLRTSKQGLCVCVCVCACPCMAWRANGRQLLPVPPFTVMYILCCKIFHDKYLMSASFLSPLCHPCSPKSLPHVMWHPFNAGRACMCVYDCVWVEGQVVDRLVSVAPFRVMCILCCNIFHDVLWCPHFSTLLPLPSPCHLRNSSSSRQSAHCLMYNPAENAVLIASVSARKEGCTYVYDLLCWVCVIWICGDTGCSNVRSSVRGAYWASSLSTLVLL